MAISGDIEFRVEQAATADHKLLMEIINGAFSVYPFMSGPRLREPEELRAEAGEAGEFILASVGSETLGCAMVAPAPEIDWGVSKDAVIDSPDAMYLGLLGVRPGLRMQGLGRRLVAEAERIAIERGFRKMTLGTLREMGNVDYYEPKGYRVVARLNFPAGHWSVDIPHQFCTMVKDLHVIREARPDEAALIAGIINRAYQVEAFFKIGDRTDASEIREAFANDTFLVLESAGEVIASVRLAAHGGEGHFSMLSVEPAHKGRGLGPVLVAAAERWALERGCHEMTLEVVNLRTELFPWYRKLGYEVCGEQPWPEDSLERISRPAHFVFMRKDLPARIGGEKR